MIIIEKILLESKYYPEMLKNIDNAPKLLYLDGNKEILNTNLCFKK